jgi:hypothetical protein
MQLEKPAIPAGRLAIAVSFSESFLLRKHNGSFQHWVFVFVE